MSALLILFVFFTFIFLERRFRTVKLGIYFQALKLRTYTFRLNMFLFFLYLTLIKEHLNQINYNNNQLVVFSQKNMFFLGSIRFFKTNSM